MSVCHNVHWKLLIDKNMNKTNLWDKFYFIPGRITNIRKIKCYY